MIHYFKKFLVVFLCLALSSQLFCMTARPISVETTQQRELRQAFNTLSTELTAELRKARPDVQKLEDLEQRFTDLKHQAPIDNQKFRRDCQSQINRCSQKIAAFQSLIEAPTEPLFPVDQAEVAAFANQMRARSQATNQPAGQ